MAIRSGEFENGNKIVGNPKVDRGSAVAFRGSNNTIIIGEGVTLNGVQFRLSGDNGVIEIGAGSTINGILAAHGSKIRIGERVVCNWPVDFFAHEGADIEIGDGCLFSRVYIRSSDAHPIFDLATGERINQAEGVKLGNRVWASQDVHILKGVSIGEGSVIGATAVVINDIPPHCLAVGSPARVVRENVGWEGSIKATSYRA